MIQFYFTHALTHFATLNQTVPETEQLSSATEMNSETAFSAAGAGAVVAAVLVRCTAFVPSEMQTLAGGISEVKRV